MLVFSLVARPIAAEEFEDCQRLYLKGAYQKCAELAGKQAAESRSTDDWVRLHLRALLALGRYQDAQIHLQKALPRFRTSIKLRLLAHEVYRCNGDLQAARTALSEIHYFAQRYEYRYSDVENLVVLGRAYLLLGADARQVLEVFFDRAKEANPEYRETYLAAGDLALSKHDDVVATGLFREGVKRYPDDPDMHFGLARALASSDAQRVALELQSVLNLNPNHVPALLYQVDHMIDSEQYEAAAMRIARILEVNRSEPSAWAYRAVIAHLRGDQKHELAFRATALRTWPTNPEVDHLIGKKLSQKYRFAEGAAYQRQALLFDSDYLPAKVQLCQDLLRLGKEVEGWQLADDVFAKDSYDVVTYNLVTLRENIEKFRTIQDDDFVVRMGADEAPVYGRRVLELLHRAKDALCRKYGLELTEPVTVEIFPDQSDFAVRTFGMPGGAGYLGVCFGKVITANSPAALTENPSNWEAVLWHEFCHVVTLQLTRNKMPRWLSEGISVYEEKQADPTWGQSMNPRYRELILEGGLTPIGELSGAFLSPPTPMHLQFAYFESSLVVEFVIDQYGLESLKRLLRDLGAGMPINDALVRHTGTPLELLEKLFEKFARGKAEQLAPAVDWERRRPPEGSDPIAALARIVEDHPTNFWGLLQYARRLMEAEQWSKAAAPLIKSIELFPEYTAADNHYMMLATVYRRLGNASKERETLEKLVALDADAVTALGRLMELAADAEDWTSVAQFADRYLAVNPLVSEPHQYLARAAREVGRNAQAIRSYETLLRLRPANPAEVHFDLAKLLGDSDRRAAKRHLLQSLEEAPRFRAAHRMLLQFHRENESQTSTAPPSSTQSAVPRQKGK